jgi:hypothetical protein
MIFVFSVTKHAHSKNLDKAERTKETRRKGRYFGPHKAKPYSQMADLVSLHPEGDARAIYVSFWYSALKAPTTNAQRTNQPGAPAPPRGVIPRPGAAVYKPL